MNEGARKRFVGTRSWSDGVMEFWSIGKTVSVGRLPCPLCSVPCTSFYLPRIRDCCINNQLTAEANSLRDKGTEGRALCLLPPFVGRVATLCLHSGASWKNQTAKKKPERPFIAGNWRPFFAPAPDQLLPQHRASARQRYEVGGGIYGRRGQHGLRARRPVQ